MRSRLTFVVHMICIFTLFPASYGLAEDKLITPPEKPLIVRELPEFQITKGEVLFSRYCSFCHGKSGEGDGLNAFSIPVKPRNFTDQEIMAKKSDAELEKVILFGGAAQGLSKYMPAFGKTFSEIEATNLIKHIRKVFSGNSD